MSKSVLQKRMGAYIDMEFTCHHCSMPAPKPQPRLRFDVQLYDGSGLLTASIEDKHAENILPVSPETLVTMHQRDQRLDISSMNKRNHGVQFYFQIRNIASSTRAAYIPRYVVLPCLPIPGSTSQSPGTTSSLPSSSASSSKASASMELGAPELSIKNSIDEQINPTPESSTASIEFHYVQGPTAATQDEESPNDTPKRAQIAELPDEAKRQRP